MFEVISILIPVYLFHITLLAEHEIPPTRADLKTKAPQTHDDSVPETRGNRPVSSNLFPPLEDQKNIIQYVIDHFDKLQMKEVMFFADLQKYFDSLDCIFKCSTSEFFNFGSSFKHSIRTLHTLPVGKVKIMAICQMNSQY